MFFVFIIERPENKRAISCSESETIPAEVLRVYISSKASQRKKSVHVLRNQHLLTEKMKESHKTPLN